MSCLYFANTFTVEKKFEKIKSYNVLKFLETNRILLLSNYAIEMKYHTTTIDLQLEKTKIENSLSYLSKLEYLLKELQTRRKSDEMTNSYIAIKIPEDPGTSYFVFYTSIENDNLLLSKYAINIENNIQEIEQIQWELEKIEDTKLYLNQLKLFLKEQDRKNQLSNYNS